MLKFRRTLIAQMRRGEKFVTWRLFDDKNLTLGDVVSIVEWESERPMGTGRIGAVREVPLSDALKEKGLGHERYASEEDALTTFRNYYGERVTLTTPVKIIRFDMFDFDPSGNPKV